MDDNSIQELSGEPADYDDEWCLAVINLFFLLEHRSWGEVTNEWKDFERTILQGSRFFPESNPITRITDLQQDVCLVLAEGECLFRARSFSSALSRRISDKDSRLNQILCKYFPEQNGKIDGDVRFHLMEKDVLKSGMTFPSLLKELVEFLGQGRRFWGFDEEESDAPPSALAAGGRANPEHISYLYAASDEKTAISELRPHRSQYISVAEVRITDSIRLYDFCHSLGNDNLDVGFMLDMLSGLFSEPKDGSSDDYYATQYISEYIRHIGFDGIRYRSSLNPDGYDYVLFDTSTDGKKYTIENSKVFFVDNVDVQIEQLAPWPERVLEDAE